MTSSISSISVDCQEPYRLARFWAEVLGFVDDPANPNHPDDPEALLIDPRGLHPALMFLPVPEDKVVKNRLHLDLRPHQLREVEVERVLALGATLVADRRNPDGTGWAVLADPEGNEFCIERSAPERLEPPPADTGMRRFPTVRTSHERDQLESLLDWYRAGVEQKVAGLAQHHAVATPLRSATSVAGLVKHLALVEDSWFSVRFAGNAPLEWYAAVDWDEDPDWEFRTAADEPLALQLERYRGACERSRQIAAAHDLDDRAQADEGRPFNLGFILVHLLEETARHLGHLDVLRELLDGATGE